MAPAILMYALLEVYGYNVPSQYMLRNSLGVNPVWRRKKLLMKEKFGKLYS